MELSHTFFTLNYNIKGYIQQQFECAKEARRLYHIIRNPTTDNY